MEWVDLRAAFFHTPLSRGTSWRYAGTFSLTQHGARAGITPTSMLGRHKLIRVESTPAAAQPRDERFTQEGGAFNRRDLCERPGRRDDAVSAAGDEVAGRHDQPLVSSNGNA